MIESNSRMSRKEALQEIRASRRRRHSENKEKKLSDLEEDKKLIAELGLKPTTRVARRVPEHVMARMIMVKARNGVGQK